ncbi:polysaccharide deacetylase family protein [Devosia sp. SL43]|uniref:polysaccharide deacetylase family protein n=1 Tax=Devosia sp. SL43 TaxID=2806348 RepID=UPI001F3FBA2B|nr:polysaccharide deacetylase family protein [Devosia sp. SL43]UJW84818.1 polysaccharide deacetylase family protein [Devosia sp. SL43]
MMLALPEPLAGMSRRLARAVPFRPFRLDLPQPVVSFSFDDFPLSAAENAAPVLEAYGARGTFYFADQLADRHENGQLIAGRAVTADLAERGHEIGGHTSSHINVQRVAPDCLIADASANTSAIAALSGQAPSSFAYPFGVVSINAKRLLAHRYAGLRGIQPGINRGWIDLAHLHAQELYDVSLPLLRVELLLDDLQRRGGWMIFYTHDVRTQPSSIGCSPAHFAAVVELVTQRGIAIETVANVLYRAGVSMPGWRRIG